MKSTIIFNNVSKSYIKTKGKYGLLTDAIGENMFGFFKQKRRENNVVRALNNISFKLKSGDVLGIIGKNGAGKSTILKLISKITFPDKGSVYADGRIGAFIELGAGLHVELTGRENIYLYGAILGMKKKEIDSKFKEIVDFAEIHRFLDTPIKRFSTGMYSRLGFSVCAFCDTEILLVDEVLAVGDINFQKKCLQKMQSFAKSNKTIVFISHDLNAINKICTRVMLLDHGKIISEGVPSKIIDDYLKKYAVTGLG